MTINHSPDAVLAEALSEQRRTELENAARAVIGDREYFNSRELERLTGTPSSTWRYWASGLMVTEMQRGTQLTIPQVTTPTRQQIRGNFGLDRRSTHEPVLETSAPLPIR